LNDDDDDDDDNNNNRGRYMLTILGQFSSFNTHYDTYEAGQACRGISLTLSVSFPLAYTHTHTHMCVCRYIAIPMIPFESLSSIQYNLKVYGSLYFIWFNRNFVEYPVFNALCEYQCV